MGWILISVAVSYSHVALQGDEEQTEDEEDGGLEEQYELYIA
jgi:hypothetical protein